MKNRFICLMTALLPICVYPNNLKNWEFGKEGPQNLHSERGIIAERQDPSENANSEANPTRPNTNSSGCLGICAFDASIPVVDLNDYFDPERREQFITTLSDACKEMGFFAVINTGVDIEILDKAYQDANEYFHQDYLVKMKDHYPALNGQRGFVPGESAKGQSIRDFKEFYHVGRNISSEGVLNVWPETGKLEEPLTTLFHALEQCKIPLEQAISEALGQPISFLSEMTEEGESLLRAIYYPPNPPEDRIWAAAHTDINLFTILPRATTAGLQVLNPQGEWIDVSVPDNAFVINVGDMLENLTNGEFRSGIHRVVDTGTGNGRLSMVLFIHPHATGSLNPLPQCIERTGGVRRYANAMQWELLAERLADLGLASPELLKKLAESGLMERLIDVGRASPEALKALSNAGFFNDK